MNDIIISMFIDDELGLDDKIEFVEKVHARADFKDETVSLLNQEKLLRTDPVEHFSPVAIPSPRRSRKMLLFPVGIAAAALAVAVVILTFSLVLQQQMSPTPYRFVIYRPDVTQAEITGSFTDWERLPMNKLGQSGYWEIDLDLPRGEHRFVYILGGDERVADPTVPAREADDFGGVNSILNLGDRI